jgi:antitoxin ParD1/3/4
MSTVRKVSIALPEDLVDMVHGAVDKGGYASASEVVREALRDWRERQQQKAVALAELRQLVRQGLNSGPGRFGGTDDIKAEARRRLERRGSGR